MSDDRVLPDVSRGDFLKLAGLSALLPLIGSVTPAAAAGGKERLYVVTHADDDVDRAALGPWVTLDADTGRFVGPLAQGANELSRREYRKPFVVAELV